MRSPGMQWVICDIAIAETELLLKVIFMIDDLPS